MALNKEREIGALLMGGDRRSIARSEEVRAMVRRDPKLVAVLVKLTRDPDWLVAQRALDLLEKFAREQPTWIAPHKRVFIGPLAGSDKWEVLLQIVRALPLFKWTTAQQKRVDEILLANVDVGQAFVRAWALDSLATLSLNRPALRRRVERELWAFEESGRPALMKRARQIRTRLRAVV